MYDYTANIVEKVFFKAENDEDAKKKLKTLTSDGFLSNSLRIIGPKPEKWTRGTRVMFVHSMEFGPNKGSKGTITRRLKKDYGKSADEYQVFWVTPDSGNGIFWTTPNDVVLARD